MVELTIGYAGGTPMCGVDVLEFQDGLITHETIYVTEPLPAPDWRAAWRAAPPAGP